MNVSPGQNAAFWDWLFQKTDGCLGLDYPTFLRIAVKVCGRTKHDWGEDLCHDALLKLCAQKAAGRITEERTVPPTRLYAFYRRSVVHLFLDRLSRRGELPLSDHSVQPEARAEVNQDIDTELAEKIRSHLANSGNVRGAQLFELRVVADLSPSDCATAMGISVGAERVLWHRCSRAIRSFLAGDYPEWLDRVSKTQ